LQSLALTLEPTPSFYAIHFINWLPTVYTRLLVEKFWTIFKTLSGGFDLYSGQGKNAMPESNIDVVDESVL